MRRMQVPAALVLVLNLATYSLAVAETASPAAIGHRVAVNGISLYYEEYGQGEPLVLLHHFGWSGRVWQPLIPELSKSYRIINVDLRGHGHSTGWRSKTFSHEQAAGDVLALLDSLKLQRVKAIGVSSGACTLLHMATRAPDRIQAMVLVGSFTHIPEQERKRLSDPHCADVSAQDLKTSREFNEYGDGQTRALSVQFCNFRNDSEDVRPHLSRVTATALLIQGDHDTHFPVPTVVETWQSLAHAYLWIVPHAGHVPIFAEGHRDEIAQAALDFLSGKWEAKK